MKYNQAQASKQLRERERERERKEANSTILIRFDFPSLPQEHLFQIPQSTIGNLLHRSRSSLYDILLNGEE